ncbi:GNAT family N-acetyltransferase [Dactylosporangium sp. NBC_01737]|uniref:GNAT family N-acetyltransferase n=1 Tax=Dactylosporangium sp. NBC_01737 TaxID=2975959 RepID=UPI002E10F7C7|nr:GNAT family N-acetyltransferase [Dactylosporangium sp. NBC_01737]
MLRTSRLVLRRWRDEDRAPFAALNADPEVMRYFPRPLTRAESDMMVDRIEASFDEHGYGLWAVDVVESGPTGPGTGSGPGSGAGSGGFIGFVGLAWQRFPAHFTPALEIGWRLARHAWGHGYATEAAVAARNFAFRPAAADTAGAAGAAGAVAGGAAAAGGAAVYGAGMDEIVSMTTRTNEPSQAVMRRIGMTRDPADDFRHPNLEPDHPLVEHVLYRLHRPAGQ